MHSSLRGMEEMKPQWDKELMWGVGAGKASLSELTHRAPAGRKMPTPKTSMS